MSETKTIRIAGVDVDVLDDEVTGAGLKAAADLASERVLVRQEEGRNQIVPDDRTVRIAEGDVFTHHAHHSKAGTARRAASSAEGPHDEPA